MDGIRLRASTRFAALREAAKNCDGFVMPQPTPSGLCLSVVATLQHNSVAVLARVVERQGLLTTPALYMYPPASLHISLIGCTQRTLEWPVDNERLGRITNVVTATMVRSAPVAVTIGRVGIIGPQLFLEVIPLTDAWSRMRLELAHALVAIGEAPITYDDPEPMHLNIARAIAPIPCSDIKSLLAYRYRAQPMTITTADLVLTDFLLRPEHTRTIARIGLEPD